MSVCVRVCDLDLVDVLIGGSYASARADSVFNGDLVHVGRLRSPMLHYNCADAGGDVFCAGGAFS